MAVERPNYTQIPNAILHEMPNMKAGELRVLLAVCRQTFGFHKASDQLSLTQLQRLTGMSRQGVVNALDGEYAQRFLERTETGNSYTYRIEVVNEVDHPLVNEFDQGSQRGLPEVVNEVDTQKKKQKKTTTTAERAGARVTRITESVFGEPIKGLTIKDQIAQLCDAHGEVGWDVLRETCELIDEKGWNASGPLVRTKVQQQLNMLDELNKQTDGSKQESFTNNVERIAQAVGLA
jgi:phage replication O-like protein O